MKLLLVMLLCIPMWAQENTFRLNVLGYQWATTHATLTFSWPGRSNTSCNGNVSMSGNVSGGNLYASGTTSDSCSTTYTPPTNQNIAIQKPVVFILADTDTSRMILTCTRNVRWSQCHALNPGPFLGRIDNGHFEVQATTGKGKEEWIKFDIVQQTAVSRQQWSDAPATQLSGDPCSRLPEGANGCKYGRSVGQIQTPSMQEAPSPVEKLVEDFNARFRAENTVGYAESSGDVFTIHSERAGDMRFHMMLADKQLMENFRSAGIKHLVYTNDSGQRFAYDFVVASTIPQSAIKQQQEKQEGVTADTQAQREAFWAARDKALKDCFSAKVQAWRAKQPSVLPEGTVPPVDLLRAQCRVEI